MKHGFDTEQKQYDAEENFVRFFQAHDQRRDTDFCKVFPELKGSFIEWKNKYNV